MSSKLKEIREKAGYTIEEVSNVLKIRKQYIVDLEEGNLKDIPGEIYIHGYTKMYHEFLGVALQKKEAVPVNSPKLVRVNNKIEKKYIVLISFFILAAIIFLYVFLQASSKNDFTIENQEASSKNDFTIENQEAASKNDFTIENQENNEELNIISKNDNNEEAAN